MEPEQHDVKTRILLAAKRLFAKQGFEGTSVRQICEEAGGNVALVSYHYGGKDNVFQAIFAEFFPGNRLEEYEPFFQDPVEGLKVLVQGILNFFVQDEELATIIHQEMSMQSPRVEMIQNNILPVWRKLGELLEKGREQGVFHFTSLDYALLMTMGTIIFPNQYKNQCLDQILSHSSYSSEEKIQFTIEYVLGALGYQERNK
ncbi:MAG TPA: TetR family transcriptional regulator [Bacillota bacterium]|nr:TetR family transcriptional regulator [Bacillota bacterium]